MISIMQTIILGIIIIFRKSIYIPKLYQMREIAYFNVGKHMRAGSLQKKSIISLP